MSSLAPPAAPTRAAAPTKPPSPPSVRIEAHYRKALIRRWFDLNVRGLIWTVGVVGGTIVLRGGSVSGLPIVIIGAIGCYVLGVYPILSARRSLLITPSIVAPHTAPLPTAVSLFSAAERVRLTLANLTSALVFSSTYCFLLSWSDSSKDLWPLSPTPRHPWHLNERFLYLTTGSLLLALFLSLKDTLTDTPVIEWPRRRTALYHRVQDSILQSVPGLDDWMFPTRLPVMKIAAIWSAAQYLAYRAIRRKLWLWLIMNTGVIISPFVINFTRSKTTVGLDLVLHLFCIAATTSLAVQVPSSMLNAYATQPFEFESFTRTSPLGADRYLMTALQSPNAYHKHFTLMEILRISHISARRKAIFADISARSGSPTLTSEIWAALLVEFGRQYQTLSTRGGSARTPSGAASRAIPVRDERSMAIKASNDIFRPVARQRSGFGSTLQGMLDGTPRAAPPAVQKLGQAAKEVEQKALQRAQGIEGQIFGRLDSTPAGHIVLAEAKGIGRMIGSWTGRRWAQNTVRRAVPQGDVIRLVTHILANLIVASADEDTYGHVQQVLAATLEAIVRMWAALLGLESEIAAQAQALGASGDIALQEAKLLLAPTRQSCERAVLRVSERFGKSLSAFRFPPQIAVGLSEICQPLMFAEEQGQPTQKHRAAHGEHEMTQINR